MSNETMRTPADVRERVAKAVYLWEATRFGAAESWALRSWEQESNTRRRLYFNVADRILALLRTPRGEGEAKPVAWRVEYRLRGVGDARWYHLSTYTNEMDARERAKNAEVAMRVLECRTIPLYASPAADLRTPCGEGDGDALGMLQASVDEYLWEAQNNPQFDAEAAFAALSREIRAARRSEAQVGGDVGEVCHLCGDEFDPSESGTVTGPLGQDDGVPRWYRCPRCARAYDAGYQQGQRDPRGDETADPTALRSDAQGEGEAQPWRKVGEEPPPNGVQVLAYDPRPDGYSYAGCWAYTLIRKGDQFYLDGERCDEEDMSRLNIEEWLWRPLPPYPGSRSKDDDVRDAALRGEGGRA